MLSLLALFWPSPHKAFVRVSYAVSVVLPARGAFLIQRPVGFGAFEFVVLATLRAAQLTRGCVPRVDAGHTVAVTAQIEIASGKIASLPAAPAIKRVPEAALAGTGV